MTLQFDTAIGALKKGGSARGPGERFNGRLEDLKAFLGGQWSEVKAALASLVADGPQSAVAAAEHMVSKGGKRVRPLSLLLAARCFSGQSSRAIVEMASVVELV